MPALKNPRHERFVQELAKGQSARDAYRIAGYRSHRAHGNRLRQQPAIRARLDELIGTAARETEVTAARVLKELGTIAFANILDYVTIDADGASHIDLTRMTREQAAALVDVSVGDDGTRRIRYRVAAKLAALNGLARMLGLFRERVEVTGANGGPVETREMSDFEAAKRIAFVLNRAKAEGTTDQLPDSLRRFLTPEQSH